MLEKLKSWLEHDQVYYTFLVLLVGVVAFGLGRWSVVDTQDSSGAPAIEIYSVSPPSPAVAGVTDDASLPTAAAVPASSAEVAVIASRNGTKYHLPSCPGAAQIKEENRIMFSSIPLATAAGYTAAANCPGL